VEEYLEEVLLEMRSAEVGQQEGSLELVGGKEHQ
jgi:hypothetical protein